MKKKVIQIRYKEEPVVSNGKRVPPLFWPPKADHQFIVEDFTKVIEKQKLKTMEETFLDRLKKEIVELEDKASKLRAFIGSDLEAYKNASHTQKRLLSMQLSTMHAYLGILELRLMELE